jgi:hypothetical protein
MSPRVDVMYWMWSAAWESPGRYIHVGDSPHWLDVLLLPSVIPEVLRPSARLPIARVVQQ